MKISKIPVQGQPWVHPLQQAVGIMRGLIPFFPQDELSLAAIAQLLDQMIETEEQLEWLVAVAIVTMSKWDLPQLRALYCTQFTPADGLPVIECTLPGFSRSELEARHQAQVMAENTRRVEQWKLEAKAQKEISSAEETETLPFPLPDKLFAEKPAECKTCGGLPILPECPQCGAKYTDHPHIKKLSPYVLKRDANGALRPIPKVPVYLGGEIKTTRELEEELERSKRPIDPEEIARRAQELKTAVEQRIEQKTFQGSSLEGK